MKANPLKEGILSENSNGIGTVSRGMVRERAVELAIINGHSPQDVSKTDWEQAKRELTGEPEADPKQTVTDAMPESERWDPVPGSTGQKAFEASSEDVDDDGRSDSAQLVEQGIAEAEHDQMLQATLAEKRADEH